MNDPQVERASDEFRAHLLRRTQRIVWRRRIQRRAVLAVAAMLLYGAGFASSELFSARAPQAVEKATAALPSSVRTATATAPQAPVAESLTAIDASELELAAEIATGDELSRLLVRAGDAYLAQNGDIERALRCYRRYLEEGDRDASVGAESWLLTALRQKRL